MTSPENNDPTMPPAAAQVDSLLASPELAKAVEQDEFKLFIDHVPIAIAISKQIDGEHRIVFVNRAFQSAVNMTLADCQHRTWAICDAFVGEDDAQATLGQAIMSGEDFLGSFRLTRDGAKPLLVQAYVGVIENDDGTENYRLLALVDVTERERTQREEFERQIRDKDMLLLELQHRVKNNLQLIVAMIRFEARTSRQGGPVNLDRLAGRIDSLQLLYQAISTEGFASEVDLGPYLSQIASAAVRAHAPDGIELTLKVTYAPVSINVALPAGLVVNELLTNALKYAFPGRDHGIITLECSRQGDDRYSIVVADDGVGLPPGVMWPAPGKLGALVMQSLRENAKASILVESAPGTGTRLTLTFTHLSSAAKPN